MIFNVSRETFAYFLDMKSEGKGLYIHIPFCKSKCAYCDFFRIVDLSKMEQYVGAAKEEMNVWKYSIDNLSTVYLGGGTPSLLGNRLLDDLLRAINENFDLSAVEEFTVECNPEDVDEKLIDVLVKNGVNRVSLGVQSLNDYMLKFLNRRHNADKVYKTIEMLRLKGIKNISVDFIFGYPKIDKYDFEVDVKKFLELDVEHISAYALSYEEGAWLTKLVEKGKVEPIEDDEVADQFNYLCKELLQKGFEHYEISNYCKHDRYSRHNRACWNRQEYLGIGPGASSFMNGKRWTNVQDVAKYIKGAYNGNIEREEEKLKEDDVYNELVMLGLRTKSGIDINKIEDKYRKEFEKKADVLIKEKMLEKKSNMYYIPEDKWFLLDMITEKCMV